LVFCHLLVWATVLQVVLPLPSDVGVGNVLVVAIAVTEDLESIINKVSLFKKR
jgi:hypothetical protein